MVVDIRLLVVLDTRRSAHDPLEIASSSVTRVMGATTGAENHLKSMTGATDGAEIGY